MQIRSALLFAAMIGAVAGPASSDVPPPSPPPDGPLTLVLSMPNLDCQACGQEAAQLLGRTAGVVAAEFDRDRVELHVRYGSARTQPDALVRVVRNAGYPAEIGAGRGSYAPEVTFPASFDVQVISRAGEDVDIDRHRAPGKVVVFDFFATWCGPCREVDRTMRDVLETSHDVAVRKINIVDWGTPVVRHYLAGVPSLPYVIVVAPSGRRVDAIAGLDVARLRRAIDAARGR